MAVIFGVIIIGSEEGEMENCDIPELLELTVFVFTLLLMLGDGLVDAVVVTVGD